LFVHGYRKDIGIRTKQSCRTTVQGRFLIADNNGYVCNPFSLDPLSRCCSREGSQFSCQGCSLFSSCCNSYEFCVSCCLNPAMTNKELALKTNIARHATAGTYDTVFDYCAGRCLHNSESVVHENAYFSEYHHCFSVPSNSSASSSIAAVEARLVGISIIVGRQGESCDSACNSRGQSCVPNKLGVLNECQVIRKYMKCEGGCSGGEQQAAGAGEATTGEGGGVCFYTRSESRISCEGLERHARRLCPCA
ncbi:hypothetical protein M569_00147, partial [Genlisea aurea]